MPHPFFDSSTYPWHLEAARELHRQLAAAITAPGRIETIYQSCGGPFDVLAVCAPVDMWREALKVIAVAQTLRELGPRLRELTPRMPKVLDAFATVESAIDPIERPGLLSRRIVVDRRALRDLLEELAKNGGAVQVLLVRGAAQAGKTWTRYPVQEVALGIGAEWVYVGGGVAATAKEAIELVFGKLGGKPPDELSTPAAYYRQCCVELAKLVRQSGKALWIIGDDLGLKDGVTKVDEEIRHFFEHVALMMDAGIFDDRVRLVLLDFPDGGVPTRWGAFWDEDRPSPNDATEDDVAECLLRWAKHKKVSLLDTDAKKSAKGILAALTAGAAGDSRSHLQRLHDEVDRTIKGMKQP